MHWAVTDAALLAQHREAIRWLNPRLALVVSTRDLAAVRELAKAPIDACFVALRTRLGDEALAALAPALADVKYLSLDGRDRPDRVFTPAGLAALGGHLRRLTYLELDSEPDDPDSPPLDAYLEVVTAVKGFRSLQVINVPEASPAQLRRLTRALPKVVRAVAISPFELETPRTVDDVERLLQPPKSRSR